MINIFTILKYSGYKIFSRHLKGHGIHSPFVFELVAGVFKKKINPAVINKVESVRMSLIGDQRLVNVEDLGSGSQKMGSGIRRVSDIARYSAVPPKYCKLLSNMSEAYGGKAIVELGTSLGISTMYMAASCPDAIVFTIEGSREVSEIASENFRLAGLNNIRLLTGSFEEKLPVIRNGNICPGLVFIDGNHRKEPLLRYFHQIFDMSDDRTVMIIDDIYYSREMAEAWNEIRSDKKVSVAINIFRMGMVFFRKGINHTYYVIRY